MSPDERELQKLKGPKGHFPIGAAIDSNGDVTVCERGESNPTRFIDHADIKLQVYSILYISMRSTAS